jgi:uncharacterized membrane protein
MKDASSTPVRYGGRPMELWISRVLLFGVLLATAIILAGLALFLAKGGGSGQSLSGLVDQQRMAASLVSILHGVARADGKSLIRLGLLALILTPIARVAMSLFLFLREGDRIFTLITAAVLCILLGGLIASALT